MLAPFRGGDLDPHYLSYLDCFNRKQFFEAHEVLEDLWLADRHGPNGAFYKGLIQLAGGFVHLQKRRPGPALALLRLARQNLSPYAPVHERLNLLQTFQAIDDWQQKLLAAPEAALADVHHSTPALKLNGANRTNA